MNTLETYLKQFNLEAAVEVGPQQVGLLTIPNARMGQLGFDSSEDFYTETHTCTEPLLVGRLCYINVDTGVVTSVCDVANTNQKIYGFVVSRQTSVAPTNTIPLDNIPVGQVANILTLMSPAKSICTLVMQGETLSTNILRKMQSVYLKKETGLLYAFTNAPTNSTGNTYVNTEYQVYDAFLTMLGSGQQLNPNEIFCQISAF